MIEDGGTAFPVTTSTRYTKGMSLRDYFAAHAPNPPKGWNGGEKEVEDIIEWRWYYADAMLKARE